MILEARHSIRHLSRAPGFCAIVILTVGLAVGGSGGLFSLLDALVLQPLPVKAPEQLVAISANRGETLFGITMPTVVELRNRQQALQDLCAVIHRIAFTVQVENAAPRSAPAEAVAGECYGILGLTPAVGRLMTAQDAPLLGEPAPVVVIGHRLWQEAFAGASDVIGRTLRVENAPLTIVGVLPESYRGVNIDESIDLAVPLPLFNRLRFSQGPAIAMHMLGRLKPGITRESAETHLRSIWPEAWRAANPDIAPGPASQAGQAESLRVVAAANGLSTLRRWYEQSLYALLALCAILLSLACMNVGGLFLAQVNDRTPVFAVQLALGAERRRLILQVFIEALLLALVSAVVAVIIAWWTSQAIATTLWTGIRPLSISVTPSASTMMAIVGASLLAGGLVSILPMLAIRSAPLRSAAAHLRGALGGTDAWRRTLLMCQVAFSLLLMVTAALFVSNLHTLRKIDLGFDPTNLRAAQLDLMPGRPQAPSDDYLRTLLSAVNPLSGLESVAMATSFTKASLASTAGLISIVREGRDASQQIGVMFERVSPGFFETTGVRLLQGREFTWSEVAGQATVAIVNQPLADRLFPEGEPVGQHVRLLADGRVFRVIGVAADAAPGDPRIQDVPLVYAPMPSNGLAAPTLLMRVRNGGPSAAVLASAIEAFHRHRLLRLTTVREQVIRFLAPEQILSGLASAFAFLGMLVAALGLYGALAHAVSRRRGEMGVRLALGASPGRVGALIWREGMGVVLAGLVIGLPLALAAARVLGALVSPETRNDPLPWVAACLVLIGTSAVAVAPPAARAAQTDPSEALRAE